MKKYLHAFQLFLLLGTYMSCAPKTTQVEDPHFRNSHECLDNENDRIGAQCKDGSFSKATGAGACSSHGGVEVWLCK